MKWGFLRLFLGYTALAIVFTWPLAAHLRDSFASPLMWRGGDPNILIWFIDWAAKSLTGATPVAPSKMLYFPQGINPFGGYDGLLIALIGAPISLVVGSPLVAYNLIVIAAFVASALATYALVRQLTDSRPAALIAGFIFGFSPYMMVRATLHLNLALTFVLPLMALALINFLEKPARKTAYRLAASALLTALCSLYYTLFGLLFIGIAFILFRRQLWKEKGITVLAGILIVFAALAPTLPILTSKVEGDRLAPYDFVSRFGAEPLNFYVPHPLTNVYEGFSKYIYADFHNGGADMTNVTESTSYFGLLLLLLVYSAIRQKEIRRSTYSPLFFWTFGIFTLLSLGMEVRIGGADIAMPYAIVWNRFPFSMIRAPDRFFIFALLAATALGAMAIGALEKKVRKPFWRYVFFGLIIIVLATERLVFPYPLYRPQVSDFYRRIAAEPGAFAVVDLPIYYPGLSDYNFLQTVHGKPIVDGEFFYSAYTKDTFAFISSNPFLRASVCVQKIDHHTEPPYMKTSLERLRLAGVRYVVIHNLILINDPDCAWLKDYLQQQFAGRQPYFTDGEITVYKP